MNVNHYGKYFEILDSLPMKTSSLYHTLSAILPEYNDGDADLFIELLIANNAPLYRSKAYLESDYNDLNYYIDNKAKNLIWHESELCFVDIETTSSNIETGQIIEIGAIKTKKAKIIDKFETFIYSPYVPEEITKLTGIESTMLEKAPKLKEALQHFKQFLGDNMFVAHNVGFDYNFISASLQNCELAPLLNLRLCTLDLSRKIILAKRHALPYLNEMLGINTQISHRALADAITSFELYKICSLSLPHEVQTLQDLVNFSKGKITYPMRSTSKKALHKKANTLNLM